MSVSGSWMTDEYEMCEAVLGFREIQGAHSGENIAKVFLEIVTEYRIENKVLKKISYHESFYNLKSFSVAVYYHGQCQQQHNIHFRVC